MFLLALFLVGFFVYVECTHIFGVERDFNKLDSDKELVKHVQEILNRLKTFKVAVHPRIRLFYQLLKRGMSDYAHRTADTLYNPSVYKKQTDNIVH